MFSQKPSAVPSLKVCLTQKKEPADLAPGAGIVGHAEAGVMPMSEIG